METRPNLLIVDDVLTNIFLLEVVLRKAEVNLIKASSGFEALEKTQGIDLALAIVDVRMPRMSGYELAVKLNEDRLDNKVPVIFLTANSVDELEIFEGYGSGAVDYIIKPFDSKILVSKVNVFIDLYNQKQIVLRDAALMKESALELKRVNAALKKSEKKYRSYIDHAPHGVFIADETGKFIEVNRAVSVITDYSEDELLTMTFNDLVPADTKRGEDNFTHLIRTDSEESELLFRHKSRSSRWMSMQSVELDKHRMLCFIQDITVRKHAEEELQHSLNQLHQLTRHIEEVRENERVVIARELHDDLGQALTAVKIDLGIIKQKVTDQEVILKVDQLSELVRETIFTVQRLTTELRPQIIDDLGLEAAIEWYTDEFARRNRLNVYCSLHPGISLPHSVSLIIFRIMQESLTNISRYANASRVDIELIQTYEQIEFSVIDNGIGIKESEIHSKKSFGIIGMKERTALMGGNFEISAGRENGTRVKIEIPLKA